MRAERSVGGLRGSWGAAPSGFFFENLGYFGANLTHQNSKNDKIRQSKFNTYNTPKQQHLEASWD